MVQHTNEMYEEEYLKEAILEMREMGCNKVADLLCDELAELRSKGKNANST